MPTRAQCCSGHWRTDRGERGAPGGWESSARQRWERGLCAWGEWAAATAVAQQREADGVTRQEQSNTWGIVGRLPTKSCCALGRKAATLDLLKGNRWLRFWRRQSCRESIRELAPMEAGRG